ncbi:cell division protein ZapA [Kurthia zopfii]|uniref:Cell division protein ZapA n=1 Tax=Kurthia zopfii TaxID=1650 RepID=A0A2U3AEU9_9BACL|nr:cell division protein ZapA [Kurthia zopfii]PWI23050.1 cell division protein ZapA [Kurthia zopfii]TDR40510.1 cell division protein ZapA [Kurthia zopfii]STX10249.1 Z ring-associated protein ZapA [Kurthia zopfii]VEI08187.1 Z ring-associated protein ZapA [Kurthia zopfii]GEK30069.1 cell division protein ZapA [Kurthia zopfii]
MEDRPKNRIAVDIYGQTYNMVGPESTMHMRAVAVTVDEQMRAIKLANPALGSTQLAVLTAANAVNDLLKLQQKFESLEAELKKQKDEVHD